MLLGQLSGGEDDDLAGEDPRRSDVGSRGPDSAKKLGTPKHRRCSSGVKASDASSIRDIGRAFAASKAAASGNPDALAGRTSKTDQQDSSCSHDLVCRFCNFLCINAVSIEPCGHSFCSSCLSQHFGALLQCGKPLQCPLRCLNAHAVTPNNELRQSIQAMRESRKPIPASVSRALGRHHSAHASTAARDTAMALPPLLETAHGGHHQTAAQPAAFIHESSRAEEDMALGDDPEMVHAFRDATTLYLDRLTKAAAANMPAHLQLLRQGFRQSEAHQFSFLAPSEGNEATPAAAAPAQPPAASPDRIYDCTLDSRGNASAHLSVPLPPMQLDCSLDSNTNASAHLSVPLPSMQLGCQLSEATDPSSMCPRTSSHQVKPSQASSHHPDDENAETHEPTDCAGANAVSSGPSLISMLTLPNISPLNFATLRRLDASPGAGARALNTLEEAPGMGLPPRRETSHSHYHDFLPTPGSRPPVRHHNRRDVDLAALGSPRRFAGTPARGNSSSSLLSQSFRCSRDSHNRSVASLDDSDLCSQTNGSRTSSSVMTTFSIGTLWSQFFIASGITPPVSARDPVPGTATTPPASALCHSPASASTPPASSHSSSPAAARTPPSSTHDHPPAAGTTPPVFTRGRAPPCHPSDICCTTLDKELHRLVASPRPYQGPSASDSKLPSEPVAPGQPQPLQPGDKQATTMHASGRESSNSPLNSDAHPFLMVQCSACEFSLEDNIREMGCMFNQNRADKSPVGMRTRKEGTSVTAKPETEPWEGDVRATGPRQTSSSAQVEYDATALCHRSPGGRRTWSSGSAPFPVNVASAHGQQGRRGGEWGQSPESGGHVHVVGRGRDVGCSAAIGGVGRDLPPFPFCSDQEPDCEHIYDWSDVDERWSEVSSPTKAKADLIWGNSGGLEGGLGGGSACAMSGRSCLEASPATNGRMTSSRAMSLLCPLAEEDLPADLQEMKIKQVHGAISELKFLVGSRSSLGSHVSSGSVALCLEVLARLAWCDDETRDMISMAGCVGEIIALMTSWPVCAGVQSNGALLLMALVRGEGELCTANQWLVAKTGGIEAICAAMQRFVSSPVVQLSALLALIPLTLENQMMQGHVCNAALPLVIRALSEHPHDTVIQIKGLVLMGVLAQGEGALQDAVRQQLAEAGAVERVESALANFGTTNDEVLWSAMFLSSAMLTTHAPTSRRVTQRIAGRPMLLPELRRCLETHAKRAAEAGSYSNDMVMQTGKYLEQELVAVYERRRGRRIVALATCATLLAGASTLIAFKMRGSSARSS
eukprot:gene22540-29665_t